MSDRSQAQAGAPEAVRVDRNGSFPNSGLPVLVYRKVPVAPGGPAGFERLFEAHGWTNSWRDGIYGFDHFHSTGHEVLGIAAGHVAVGLGGPGGPSVRLEAGDVVVLPAGVAHRNDGASGDLLVVGAYADGRDVDLCRGDPAELDAVLASLARVPLPRTDPVLGAGGPLVQVWTPVPEAPPGVA